MTSATAITTASVSGISRTTGSGDEHEHVGAGHDQLAVREVDQAHDPEDHGDAEREERVEAPERDRVDRVLDHEVRSHVGEQAHRRSEAQVGGVESGQSGELVAAAGERDPPRAQDVGAVGELDRSPRRSARRAERSRPRCGSPRARRRPRRSGSARGPATARRAAAAAARRPAHGRSRAAAARRPRASRPAAGRSARRTGKRSSTRSSAAPVRARSRPRSPAEREVLGHRERREDVPALGHERDAAPRDVLGPESGERRHRGTRSSPPASGTRPTIAASVVDLPAPFEPTRPTISPSSTSRSRCWTAGAEP